MKKQVLIITSNVEITASWLEREQYVKDFCKALETRLDDVIVRYTTYQDLYYVVKKGHLEIRDTRNDLDLKEADLVHFKNWMYELEDAFVVAFYLKRHGVTFFDTEVNVALSTGKLSQMFRLAAENIPVPDTFYAHKPYLKKMFSSGKLIDGFVFPLIMKADDGSKGDNNYLIKSAEEALPILADPQVKNKEFVLQNFIPNDGDYRFLFIGVDEPPLVFSRLAQEGSHLNNTSKGGTGEFIELSSLPQKYIDYAEKAATILQREIGGVDIIVDKTTSLPYVLEVNGTPAIATGYGLEEKLDKFAGFLQRYFESREEE
jgi:glutathione synthase/RimK-type ligase-like ATP-grasp enzyme